MSKDEEKAREKLNELFDFDTQSGIGKTMNKVLSYKGESATAKEVDREEQRTAVYKLLHEHLEEIKENDAK